MANELTMPVSISSVDNTIVSGTMSMVAKVFVHLFGDKAAVLHVDRPRDA